MTTSLNPSKAKDASNRTTIGGVKKQGLNISGAKQDVQFVIASDTSTQGSKLEKQESDKKSARVKPLGSFGF